MPDRVRIVEAALGFIFEGGFTKKFEELGSPEEDLELWYRNALVYLAVTEGRPLAESQRRHLVTLIESSRFDAMFPPPFGEPVEFDLTGYDFSEDVLSYKEQVVAEVLKQEHKAPLPPYSNES
jgi:hypothetical protein